MSKFIQVQASLAGVAPARVAGYEHHGLMMFTTMAEDNAPAGAQCAQCHTTVWADPRRNAVLSEVGVGGSGPEYRAYYRDMISRFMHSLPPCPVCGKHAYDRFLNNVSFPRFADGTELPPDWSNLRIENVEPNTVLVWLVEPDDPSLCGQPYPPWGEVLRRLGQS